MNVLTTEIKKTDKELTNDEYLAKYFPGMSAFDVHHKFRNKRVAVAGSVDKIKKILVSSAPSYREIIECLDKMVKSDK